MREQVIDLRMLRGSKGTRRKTDPMRVVEYLMAGELLGLAILECDLERA